MKSNTTGRIHAIIIVLVTLAIFYILFSKISISSVVSILLTANPGAILLALLLEAIILGISGKRWHIILDAMKYALSYRHCLTTLLASIPFSIITPAKTGDFVRAYFLRQDIPMTKTIGGVLTERLVDFLILVLLAMLGLYLSYSFRLLSLLSLIVLACCALLVLLVWSHKLPVPESFREKVSNLSFSLQSFFLSPGKFAAFILSSLLIWFITMVQASLFFMALNIDVPFAVVVGNIPIAILIGMIPVSLGGMGTRDTAIIVLFSAYAMADQLLCVGLLFSLIRYWIPGIIGLAFIPRTHELLKTE